MAAKRLIRISYFTMLTTIGAWISFAIPFSSVKISLQPVFVVLSGLVLGARDGALAQTAYVLLGIAGLPVFANYSGGIGYALSPSFGYLLGFIPGAFVSGLSIKRLKTLSTLKVFTCAVLGLVPIYLVGLPYQFLILILYTGSTLTAALINLSALSIMLVKDCVILYLICIIYPRIMTMIGQDIPMKAVKQ